VVCFEVCKWAYGHSVTYVHTNILITAAYINGENNSKACATLVVTQTIKFTAIGDSFNSNFLAASLLSTWWIWHFLSHLQHMSSVFWHNMSTLFCCVISKLLVRPGLESSWQRFWAAVKKCCCHHRDWYSAVQKEIGGTAKFSDLGVYVILNSEVWRSKWRTVTLTEFFICLGLAAWNPNKLASYTERHWNHYVLEMCIETDFYNWSALPTANSIT